MEKKKNKKRSQMQEIWKRLKKNKLAVFGIIVLSILIVTSIFARLYYDFDTQIINQNMANKLKAPSAEHWFGTDSYGRDIFARVLYGGGTSLFIGVFVVGISLVIGSFLGSVAGYYGGKIDNIIMRIMDMLLAIPGILLAVAIVSVLGPGLRNLMIAMSISSIPRYARLVRSSVLTVKEYAFIESARAIGHGDARIIFKEVLPNTFSSVIIQVTIGLGGAIIGAAGLSFLGLGIMPPKPEWGAMLAEGKEFIRYSPYLVLFPGISILLASLSLNFIGDGLRDALDPKLKD